MNGRKSLNWLKIHELICHFIRGYLVPLPPLAARLAKSSDALLDEAINHGIMSKVVNHYEQGRALLHPLMFLQIYALPHFSKKMREN